VTRPIELRRPEDAQAGDRYAAYQVGERVGPLRFSLEPPFIDEFIAAAALDESLYRVGERPAAPPQVLALFLMATLHTRYAPLPGTVMAELGVELHAPIWRDEVTRVEAEGTILEKAERRGRRYVGWEADFRREGGPLLARFTNTFIVPA
jgi:hypothetical protein